MENTEEMTFAVVAAVVFTKSPGHAGMPSFDF